MFEWLRQVVQRLRYRATPAHLTSIESARQLEDVVADMRELIRIEVVAGYHTEQQIWQRTVELYQDEQPAEELIPHARAQVAWWLAQQRREQRSWPALTDCERLDAAFEALEQRGLVCRQNWTCCGSCGSAEIEREMQRGGHATGGPLGYVYFHEQDTLAAVEGMGLYLSYGSRRGDESGGLAVARMVVAELERQGLAVDWNGAWSRRIHVDLEWQRRCRSDAP